MELGGEEEDKTTPGKVLFRVTIRVLYHRHHHRQTPSSQRDSKSEWMNHTRISLHQSRETEIEIWWASSSLSLVISNHTEILHKRLFEIESQIGAG